MPQRAMVNPGPLSSNGGGEWKRMEAHPRVARIKNFIADATAFILEKARKAMAERNEFRIALSGGNTPAPFYARIAAEAHDFPWDRVRFTFGDERCVPPNDPQSAAQEYENQLDAIATERDEPIYQHDLILLGVGDDGHTASLFPGTAALEEMTRRVVANFVPKLNAWRLTFTFPLINHARHILFLVGASKSPRLIERVLAGDQQFPAARVNPSAGEVTWMIGE